MTPPTTPKPLSCGSCRVVCPAGSDGLATAYVVPLFEPAYGTFPVLCAGCYERYVRHSVMQVMVPHLVVHPKEGLTRVDSVGGALVPFKDIYFNRCSCAADLPLVDPIPVFVPRWDTEQGVVRGLCPRCFGGVVRGLPPPLDPKKENKKKAEAYVKPVVSHQNKSGFLPEDDQEDSVP